MGERLDSNQQPWAYEAPALPLSYAPKTILRKKKAAGRDRTGDLSFTRRLLCPLSYHGIQTIHAVSGIRTHVSGLEDRHSAG
jgi:hypothetical protein